MARKHPDGKVFTQIESIALGIADGDVALPLMSPSAGAIVDEIIFNHQVAGTATDGSYTIILEELGGTVALTHAAVSGEVDVGAGTVFTAKGTGVGSSKAGITHQLQVTEVDTVTGELTVTVGIWWIT